MKPSASTQSVASGLSLSDKKKDAAPAPRRKLKPSDNAMWTDDVIDSLTNGKAEEKAYSVPKEMATGVFKDTMEDKIARVKERQKEAENRTLKQTLAAKKSSTLKPEKKTEAFKETLKATISKVGAAAAQSKSDILNAFFSDYLLTYPAFMSQMELKFPLNYFDSSLFDEQLHYLDQKFPKQGSYLAPFEEENINRFSDAGVVGFGVYLPCKILRIIDADHVEVLLDDSETLLDTFVAHRMHVVADSHDISRYCERITTALQLRKDCISLLRYHYCIANMPFSATVVPTLTEARQQLIHDKVMSMQCIKNVNFSIFQRELASVIKDFHVAQNQILFMADLLNPTNFSKFVEMNIPISSFKTASVVPIIATVPCVSHNSKGHQSFLQLESFLGSRAAVAALQGAVRENINISNCKIINILYEKTMTLEKYERYITEQMMTSVRAIKQEWVTKAGNSIRSTIVSIQEEAGLTPTMDNRECAVFDLLLRNVHEYDRSLNLVKPFLDRINFMMSDVLTNLVSVNVREFTTGVVSLCGSDVIVKDIRNIQVIMPPDSIYKLKVLPPLFSVSFRVTVDDRLLNSDDLDKNKKEIATWNKTKEALEGGKCPIAVVKAVMGKTFEYNYSIEDFKNVVLKVFDNMILEFLDVNHVRKFVMDKIYFPVPKPITSITPDLDWVKDSRDTIAKSMEKATAPLTVYLNFFRKFESFINIDNESYLASKLQVVFKDPESQEIELPVQVNLQQVIALIEDHLMQIQDIEESLPVTPISCGLFLVEVVSVRNLLLEKHKSIIKLILTKHTGYCELVCKCLDDEFKKIIKNLSKKTENIEQIAESEEYVASLTTTLAVLQTLIGDMMSFHGLLDRFKFKTDTELAESKWVIYSLPAKIHAKCGEVAEQNAIVKSRYQDDMLTEQQSFVGTLKELDDTVKSLEQFNDVGDVDNISIRIKEVEASLKAAQEKSKLFNSREVLFNTEPTDYEEVGRIVRSFEPYSNLWQTAKEWTQYSRQWTQGKFVDLNSEEVEKNVEKYEMTIAKAAKYFQKAGMSVQFDIATQLKQQVESFVPEVPLIVTLRNPGMRTRHWEKIASTLNVDIMPIENFTTEQILALGLRSQIEFIQKIGEAAAKEYQIETALDKMSREWENQIVQIHSYKETGTGVLKGVDDINTILDEQITMTQTIMFSAFKGPFEARIDEWNRKLCQVSDLLEVWVAVQRNWLYLQPIFESPDINRQLPAEGKKFSTVDKNWRQTISAAKNNQKVIDFMDNEKLYDRFKESEILLDQVQKGLSDYLETKRSVFARFYFLSNDELLSILSESNDVKLVQPHFKKCFEGIDKVKFLEDLKIDRMISPENEEVIFTEMVNPVGKNVEVWMLEVEAMMKISIRDVMKRAIEDYTVTPRPKWMQKWAGMCVLNGSQMHWTTEMETFFIELGGAGPKAMYDRMVLQLADMTILVRGKLSNAARTTVGALTVIDVHARDVIWKLVSEEVDTKDNFGWTSQLRYYWDGDLTAQMVAATRPYGYEYLGNSFRLVITPLTDKCYLTLMGALQMIFGGAPAGPAGTGKTETTKDLAKALAMQCVVFNCSDGLDYIAMGKFFKGLAACGAWACFDEFNRINIEVLSVIGQQIMSIQMVVRAKETRMNFEGSDINVSDRFAVFITMNPGYAGRSALPDSLQALFRPVAMMVPDYALIGEIMFFAYGFEYGKECGSKMVTTFKLCSEQLSSQPHYDYGMRAVKTTITAAGNLKRAEPEADEMVLLLRALQDVNIPKFLEMDLPLFEGIISDLFPGKKRPELDYGALMKTMKDEIIKAGLQPAKFFISKVIQLYEMIVVRHGLMLVGPTGGGKSRNLHILEETLGSLCDQGVKGFAYEHVKIYQLNPKSITMGQMYGEVDPNTMEWKDGIMSTMYRGATIDTPDRKWIMFDGPVDAIWIESMNTVLDDNKKLCLLSGEIIKMSNEMTMMFEVEDLVVASPATVSRVGIIYMEPKGLGLDVLLQSWLQRLPPCTPQLARSKLLYLFDTYLPPSIFFLRSYLKELAPTVDNNLAESLLRIIDCYLAPYYPKEDMPGPSDIMISDLNNCIDALFIFALIWSVGATTDENGRRMFDEFIRSECGSNKFPWMFPKTGMVYDYLFNLETKKWIKWMDIIDKFEVDPKQAFSEIIVPTTDSVRNTYLLDLLLTCDKHVLMVGNTGTGKTININQYLMGAAKVQGRVIPGTVIPITMTLSANASANQTQDFLDSKMDKRRKGVFGPPGGKKMYVYVDDLNMPKRETYGAQPPIELLKQWFDQDGWYDRKELSFRKIVDLVFVCSMGPPGGGRQQVTPRFIRHFNMIGYVEMSDASKAGIFGSILTSFLTPFENNIVQLSSAIVEASIDVFATIVLELLPTPSKSHYTFNLRDLAKVFQGMLMIDVKRVTTREQLARVWIHESQRVFADRLTCEEDHLWLRDLFKQKVEGKFNMEWDKVVPRPRLIMGDFMIRETENKVYDEIDSMEKLKLIVEDFLSDHNSESKRPMPLVMFSDALEHVARIARILRQPQGNALLLGVGGSGRQSMTKLATYIMGYGLSNVEIVKGYTMNDWRDDIKKVLMQAGVKDKPVTFLFSDVQIINERMVEDINNILNSGDVPNLYAPEDFETITAACRIECQKRRIPPTKLNVFAQYIIRVRRNIHICLAMSPLGEVFRNRLRNFPSLVNCCTIDWFTNWPAEALGSVGTSILRSSKEYGLGDNEEAAVNLFKHIHLAVEKESALFYEVLRRKNYVTPTSYLELLSSFGKLIGKKRAEIATKKDRLTIGLDKLTETKKMVGVMQEELTVLAPILVKTQKEVAEMMVAITKDKASAAETKAKVEVEEAKANIKAAEAKAIADDAQKDLAEAIPALEEAVKCLNDLKKSDIDEVKSLKTPPAGVVLTIKACCVMFDVKPIKKNDPNTPGKKIDDYWEAGLKGLLSDAKVFLNSLFTFDKDNIPDRIIKQMEPFMQDPGFTPAAIERASKACTAICMWARAMYKYHFVALGVAPKRAKLKEAEDELAVVMAILAAANKNLKEVNDRLATLEKAFNEAVEKKDMLEKKEQTCKIQLYNADKLIGGLGGEEIRWRETVVTLNALFNNVLGDVIVSAGCISYLGPFTADFRAKLVASWHDELKANNLAFTPGCSVETTLADPVKLRSWQLCNLPSDSLSTQNGIMMDNGRRWPLLIDPQGQANRYIRSMSKNKEFAANGMDVVKLTDKNFLRTLENGVQFGRWVLLENIQESLDAALEPILLQQKFKQGGQDMIKIGDNTIPYNDSFRFFLTTKLSNPHYAPEVQVKVSLLLFTITLEGLEEQLLNVVVAEEMPELAKQKADLVLQNAASNKQLYDIESEILYLLSNSKGNILDDTVLIETLAQAKVTGEAVKQKMKEAALIETEIALQSENYRPVAKRASLLYFVIADLGFVDPMYQYSLQWFTQLFVRGIGAATPSNEIPERVSNLNDFFTFSVYTNICRSLFERHKLLFSFILCVKILQGDNLIDYLEYRFLLSGISPEHVSHEMPKTNWLEANVWEDLCEMAGLTSFKQFPGEFGSHVDTWKEIFDSAEPHKKTFPGTYNNVTPLQRLCVLRCLRRDKIELCMQDFITTYLGGKFIQPPPFDLKACYNDSLNITPLIFVLSSGSDPNKDLDILANEMNMSDRLKRIALGQGQGKKASTMVEKGIAAGDWVMLQNCHLSISWMPILEQICESFEPSKMNPEFRLWLTSMPSESFPTSVLQSGVKITKEPPKGLRANLRNTYIKLDNDKLNRSSKPREFQKLLFGLSFFHAIVIERKKFGPLGWNIPYEFNDTDFDISAAQMQLYVDSYAQIPFKVLQQLTSMVNYGGRVTDDKDMRTSDILVSSFLCQDVLNEGHKFSKSGLYFSLTPNSDDPWGSYMSYIESLPLNAEPEIFGMHDNANITCAITAADDSFGIILTLQPRVAGGTGISREDQIIEFAKNMQSQLIAPYDVEQVGMQYPTDYLESMNTVLVQEAQRYNGLLYVMHYTLPSLQKALKGLVVLSAELEAMGNAIFDQRVPLTWTNVAYPSLKPLGPWFKDLLLRLQFMTTWIDDGVPKCFWISGFFFPQGFTTAALQNFARKYKFPIDTVSFSFVMKDETVEEIFSKPEDGCFVTGLFLEGARWDKQVQSLVDPKPKELFSPMPTIHILPIRNRKTPQSGIYRCPVYKVLTRSGTLSTTGHSTNFVMWIEIPSNHETIFRSSLVSETNAQVLFCDNSEWIKGGVACFCALRY